MTTANTAEIARFKEALSPSLSLNLISPNSEAVDALMSDIEACGDIVYGDENTWEFDYHTINEAYPGHREAVAMSAFWTNHEIAVKLRMSVDTVQKVFKHPPMIRFRNFIDIHRRQSNLAIRADFSGAMTGGIKLMKERIENKTVDDRALGTWMKTLLEHDPEHMFPKVESTKRIDAFDDEALNDVAKRALKLRLEHEKAQAIAVTSQEITPDGANGNP